MILSEDNLSYHNVASKKTPANGGQGVLPIDQLVKYIYFTQLFLLLFLLFCHDASHPLSLFTLFLLKTKDNLILYFN